MLRLMARITAAQLIFDEHVIDHIWERHLITMAQVQSLITRRHVIIRNFGFAPYRLIGRDESGRCIAVPIAPTDDWLTWRVVSGWYCDKDEQARLR